MKKEKVENIVKNLMEKLHMKNRDLDDIMRCYSAEGHTFPLFMHGFGFRLQNTVENEESEDDEIPECAQKVYFP